MSARQDQPEGVASSLPSLNADQCAWAHHAARLLARRGIATSIVPAQSSQAGWYKADGLAFRPPPETRAPLGAAADALVSALVLHNSSLDEIEQATGLAAEFNNHGELGNDLACVRLTRAGEPLGEIAPLAPPPIPCPAAAPVPVPLSLAATRLTLDEAEALGGGDLLLLSGSPWPVIENAASPVGGGVAFDPQAGRLISAFTNTPNNFEAALMSDPTDTSQMTVPVALQLPDAILSQEDLAALSNAGSIDLGPVTEGLQITISVGGLPVGKGEIVRVGDRFAVLVESPSPAANQPGDQSADTAAPAAEEASPGDPLSDTGELAAEAK